MKPTIYLCLLCASWQRGVGPAIGPFPPGAKFRRKNHGSEPDATKLTEKETSRLDSYFSWIRLDKHKEFKTSSKMKINML